MKPKPNFPIFSFDSFFVPAPSLIIALKSEEEDGKTRTYVTLFDKLNGNILVKDQLISNSLKYEGIEFV